MQPEADNAATMLRCDGSCGYRTTEGKPGLRCPNCDYGLLVKGGKK